MDLVTFTEEILNSKVIPLQTSKNLFTKIALFAETRSLNLRLVFKSLLGLLPKSLAQPTGTLKKTSKAVLLYRLEGKVEKKGGSRGQLLFKKIVATSAIKQWESFLLCNENKNHSICCS